MTFLGRASIGVDAHNRLGSRPVIHTAQDRVISLIACAVRVVQILPGRDRGIHVIAGQPIGQRQILAIPGGRSRVGRNRR